MVATIKSLDIPFYTNYLAKRNGKSLLMIFMRVAADAYCPGFLAKWKARALGSSLGYRLARGAFWSLVGSLISRGMGMMAGIVVARILGKHDYGHLGIVQSTVGMFGVFAGFGMGLTANKHIAEFKATDPLRAGRVIGLSSLVSWITSGIMALGLFLAAPLLARRTLADPAMAPLLQIASLLLLLSGVNGAQTGALAGFEAFKTIARVNLTAGLLAFPVTLACAWWGGVPGAVWALVMNMATNCVFNYLALRQEAAKAGVSLGYRKCLSEWPVLWQFSLPAVLGGAVSGPATWATSALLVNQRGGYGEMGVFSAVQKIRIVPELVLTMLLAPLLPVLSEKFSNKERAKYQKAARAAFVLSLIVTAPVALVLLTFPNLTLAPYGKDFHGPVSVVQWAMADLAIVGVFTPLSIIIASMNRMWFGFGYNLAYALVCLGLSILFVPGHGAAGLAAAITLAHAGLLGPCLWYMYSMERELICGTCLWELGVALGAVCLAIYLVSYWAPGFSAAALCLSLLPGLLWSRKQLGI
jgi:O-antigen/teichoic acid export membrane protein